MPVMPQYYTMHDLAISVLDDELIVIDAANKSSNTREQKYCRYAVLTNYDGQTKLSNILSKKVRALHFSSSCQELVAPYDGSFSFAKGLRILDFSGCSRRICLPSSTGQLNQLKYLIAPNMQNKRLPDSIGQLTKLQHLNLSGSSLMSTLPKLIGGLKSLVHFNMSYCISITVLLESLGGLENLEHLDLSYCFRITVLPESLGGLKSLEHLDISYCSKIIVLLESLGGLKSLEYLYMNDCFRITVLPESLGGLIPLNGPARSLFLSNINIQR
jgi:Leucine-rich repeat (LRR) protein